MVAEMITLRMNNSFLKEIDRVVKKENYQNRTEFIRNALREKIDSVKYKQALEEIAHLKGASKNKTSDEELEQIRKKAFKEFDKRFK